MLGQLNHTFLSLIPKVDSTRKIEAFQPISLCNAIYKVIAKVAANRLKLVIPNIIFEEEKAFVKGRQLLDGVTIVHELIHFLNQHKW